MTPDTKPAAPLVEIWRGSFFESAHSGHAVVVDDTGQIIAAWGDPNAIILPRSSCKMIQALPLIESGAAEAFDLTTQQLALSCASHNGAAIHHDGVSSWLNGLGLSEEYLRCGPQTPQDTKERDRLHDTGKPPCQLHNNCSGKHAGFLTLNMHLGGSPEYIEPDHIVQRAVKDSFEAMTGEASPGYGIDGCSAPNFACTITGLARAAARMARPSALGRARADAANALVTAMMTHPELVAGEGRACTTLMRSLKGAAAVKTGAEGVFLGILPERGWGIAVKIMDGATRASECAIAALLVRAGLASPEDPAIARYLTAQIRNRRNILTGQIRPDPAFFAEGASLG